MHKLTARTVATLKTTGKHSDGGGLYLVIRQRGTRLERSWVFRWRRGGRGEQTEKSLSLGTAFDVSLAEARNRAGACRKAIESGRDPKLALARNGSDKTFGTVADDLVKSITAGFKNAKHRAQWGMTLGDTYCSGIRRKPVAKIATADVLEVLQPIWQNKPETASRLRGRIERVLDAAKVQGLRDGENPARWRGHLKLLLSRQNAVSRGHHLALPWQDAPEFMARLRALESVSARALEWTILTAARTSETINAPRSEVKGNVWIIPAERMKMNRQHRVPLSDRCLEIFEEVGQLGSPWLFPNGTTHLSTSAMAECLKGFDVRATVHGFRSTFEDWIGDATTFPEELADLALAHRITNKTKAAYRRGDALEKRRVIMSAWEQYLMKSSSNVIALHKTVP